MSDDLRRRRALDLVLSQITSTLPALRDAHRDALAAGDDATARHVEQLAARVWGAVSGRDATDLAVARRIVIEAVDRAAREGGGLERALAEIAFAAPALAARIAAHDDARSDLADAVAGWLHPRGGAGDRIVGICRALRLGAEAARKEIGPARAELAARAEEVTRTADATARARRSRRRPKSME